MNDFYLWNQERCCGRWYFDFAPECGTPVSWALQGRSTLDQTSSKSHQLFFTQHKLIGMELNAVFSQHKLVDTIVFGKLQIKTAKTFIDPKLCLYTFHIMNQVWMKWFIPLHGHFKWCLFYILMSQYIYIIFPSSFRQCVINIHQTEGRPVIVHCSDGWDRTPQVFVWQKRQYILMENIHFLNCLSWSF